MTMGVDGVLPRNSVASDPPKAAPPAGSPGDHGFASLLPAAPRPSMLQAAPRPPMQQTAAPSSTAALVQAEVDDVFARQKQDRDGRRHGRAMLKALGAVQLALLGGDEGAARDALDTLAGVARDAPSGDDPVLRLILREIGVRAAVELARHERHAA
jgi:hypothetical protein